MRMIRPVRSALLTAAAGLLVLLLGPVAAQPNDTERFVDAAKVVELFTTDEQHGIPADILQRARGIAVIPKLIRGGLVFGGRRGRGVLAIRSPNGEWSNPAFVTLTGGSFGAQFGAESADVVLVFANDRSVRNIASGKFTLGGDATAIAGPLGRRTQAAVTGKAEVYVYMHSRGLFAGAAFEGTRAACRSVHRRSRRRPRPCRFSMRCERPPCCPAALPLARRTAVPRPTGVPRLRAATKR
jgi:lipid-binding SYLF domain-containing protein